MRISIKPIGFTPPHTISKCKTHTILGIPFMSCCNKILSFIALVKYITSGRFVIRTFSWWICIHRSQKKILPGDSLPVLTFAISRKHLMDTFSALLAICVGNSPHKGQWRGALGFHLICAWTNGWVTNRDVGDFKHHRGRYGVTVMRDTIY